MARYSIEDTTLIALGDAIRGKVGDTKEALTPLEPYTLHTNTKTDDMSEWINTGLFRERQTYYPLVNGASQYKVKYSLTKGHSTVDSVSLFFRDTNDIARGDTTELQAGQNKEAIMTLPSGSVPASTIQVYESMYSSIELDLEIIPLDANGIVMENEITYVFNTMSPQKMAEAIEMMEAGVELPDAAFKISGACLYKFYGGGWDWFIDLFGDKIVTDNISSCNYMFGSSKVEYIPFDLSLSNTITSFDNMFYGCSNLKELPNLTVKNKISIPTAKYNFASINGIFGGCQSIREIPEDYFDSIFEDGYMEARERFVLDGKTSAFSGCYSLRKVPYRIYYAFKSYGTAYYYSLYSSLHSSCYALDEVVNLPVEPGPYLSNAFGSTFSNCRRLARLTFEKNEDDTAKAVNWRAQTIDLSSNIGYSANSSSGLKDIIGYNSGITADKEVTDTASYEALKNNPDWFTRNPDYSRYNKTSAIETINSLPDVSASGGVNTIKFKGAAGSLTDGGAINTMTEAEIAVATAKGWTVTMA